MRYLDNSQPTPFKQKTSIFDQNRADLAVSFINCLKHTKGQWHGLPGVGVVLARGAHGDLLAADCAAQHHIGAQVFLPGKLCVYAPLGQRHGFRPQAQPGGAQRRGQAHIAACNRAVIELE